MKLTPTVQKHIITWSNKLGGTPTIDWVSTNHIDIEQLIETYENINTKKSYYISLSNIFRKLRKNKLQKYYISKAITLNKEHVDNMLDQKPVHNYIPFSTIVDIRDKFTDYVCKRGNLIYLILSLYTHIPPLRNDYSDMRIVSKLPKCKQNYLLNTNGKYTIVLRDYKTVFSYGEYKKELPEVLNKIINKSLLMFPRKYLLSVTTDGSKPLTKRNVRRYLEYLGLNIDILRSSYVTYIYNRSSTTNRIKKELASNMLHSVSEASKTYHKVI